MSVIPEKSIKIIFLKFFVPFLIWIFLFQEFFQGKSLLWGDTFAVYSIVKFYLNNFIQGVFPAWNPFSLWGMGHLMQIAEFTPVWYFVLILTALNVKVYYAFIITLVIYFFMGAIGFYHLVKLIVKDEKSAYFAFLLFLFSSAGMTMFVQLTFVIIFVPAIWFFYFFIDFFQTFKRSSCLFMSYAWMVVMSSYVPFYTVNTFFAFMTLFLLFYPSRLKECIFSLIEFSKKNFLFVGFCLFGIFISLLTPLISWITLKTGMMPMVRPAQLTYNIVRNGGIPVTEILREFSLFSLFFHGLGEKVLTHSRELFFLENLSHNNHRIFYIPIFAHIVLFLSLFTRITKRVVFILCLSCVLFLIVLVDLSPVYEFLFKHIFYFKMFRNLFFMMPFLMCAYIILAAEQFKFLRLGLHQNFFLKKILFFMGIFVVHVTLFLFLKELANVSVYTYISLLLSFIFFSSYLFFTSLSRGVEICLVLIIVSQPWGILRHYSQRATAFKSEFIRESRDVGFKKINFQYQRPAWSGELTKGLTEEEIYHQYNRDFIYMTDGPGFISDRYGYPTNWTARLFKSVSYQDISAYIMPKFLLYDQVEFLSDDQVDFKALSYQLGSLENKAFISSDAMASENAFLPLTGNANVGSHLLRIVKADDWDLKVLKFNVNSLFLETNFKENKFLVYNDSYHPRWKAFLNGAVIPIYRSNYAFKGIFVPAGKNKILLRIDPVGGRYIYPFIFILFFVYLGVGLFVFFKEKKMENISV